MATRRPVRARDGRLAGTRSARVSRPSVSLDVAWADIAQASGDVFVVGHYEGVMPQAAELALDRAVSGVGSEQDATRLVITDMTVRGVLRGALGEVVFVPRGRRQFVAVAGMGRPGTFQETEVRRLWRSVARTIGRLPARPAISTVLIGSGVGNLDLQACIVNMLAGFGDAVGEDPALVIGRVRIVERNLDRALEILGHARTHAAESSEDVRFRVRSNLVTDRGGVVPQHFGYSMMLAALAKSAGLDRRSPVRTALNSLMRALPRTVSRKELMEGFKARAEANPELRHLALQFRLSSAVVGANHGAAIADRITYYFDGALVRCTAITNSVTVTERELSGPLALVERSVDKFNGLPTDPHAQQTSTEHGIRLYQSLVHQDLEPVMDRERPLVIEVDRAMAGVPWEALRERTAAARPLGIRRPVARQLRTLYSSNVSASVSRPLVRALVIAAPQETEQGDDPLFCREEAEQVARILHKCGVQYELRIGKAFVEGGPGPVKGVPPADLTEALADLLSGEFELIHYCGHAVFDAERPDRTGWVFADDVLTARYLEQMRRPPLLVVANACQTSRLSLRSSGLSGARNSKRSWLDTGTTSRAANVVAGLADQFFKQGVADYVGTGWEVSGKPARMFAGEFYGALFDGNGRTLGEAVMRARTALHRQRNTPEYAAAWAAYQHYGSPTRTYVRP